MELAERLSARLVALLPLRLLAGDALPISDRRPGLSGEPVLSASGAYCVADERMLLFCRYALFLSLAFGVMKQRKADMAYRSRAHRHPADSPHPRRPRARPTPAGRKGSDSLGRQQNEYLALPCARPQRKDWGWSGPQVRLMRPD